MNLKTFVAKPDELMRRWYLVNAEGKVLGRLASRVAAVLRGKHKPIFTPHVDCGDHIVVINAEKVALTGDKWTTKLYRHHTGYTGHLKTATAGTVRASHPERLIEEAVRGMLPKTSLGRAMFKKLKVYRGPEHPHRAQQPEPLP